MNCSLPGSSIHGILQARMLKWITISFSRWSFQPKDRTQISCIAGRPFTVWATREVIGRDGVKSEYVISFSSKTKGNERSCKTRYRQDRLRIRSWISEPFVFSLLMVEERWTMSSSVFMWNKNRSQWLLILRRTKNAGTSDCYQVREVTIEKIINQSKSVPVLFWR